MSLAVLELNDQLLLIQAEGAELCTESGFARLTPGGIETGEPARASAWREPQHSYNQYWNQLNQTPLAARQAWARHHADIAFAQLKNLWMAAGSPDSLILLVPASFNDTQLSLLLGLAGALPAKIHAVIDNALAACVNTRQNTLFVDMQMHQSVVSLCKPDGEEMRIADQEVFPDLGLMQIYNSVARHISRLLVESNRYDPLHASDSEQAVFDDIPAWLARLRFENELAATVESDHGELAFILRNDDVTRLIGERLGNVRSFLNRHSDFQIILSDSSAILAGLSKEFATAKICGQSAAIDYCHSNSLLMTDRKEGLVRIQSLHCGEQLAETETTEENIATHVLYRNQAMPLNHPLSIRINGQGLLLENAIDKQAALTVVIKNKLLEAVFSAPDLDISIPKNCRPGESITIGEHQLRLISVQHEV
ncbi:MAG: hypothetical protein ACI9H8_000568 [Lysobacterales bacterium]|jgi:hypothetical protein